MAKRKKVSKKSKKVAKRKVAKPRRRTKRKAFSLKKYRKGSIRRK